jgi:hypothetical protein
MATSTHVAFVAALSLAGLTQNRGATKPSPNNTEVVASVSDREKWETEKALREGEISIKARDQVTGEAALGLKEKEQSTSQWQNPLILAIITAALAIVGNTVVAFINGRQQRRLEAEKSEQQRILEMIKTGNADKAAENLKFLLAAGLISDPSLQARLQTFLDSRNPGSGPSLPSSYEKEHPSFRDVSSEWLATSKRPDESVNAIWVSFTSKAKKTYLAIHVFQHPSGPYILLCSSDKDREDFMHVEAMLSQAYRGTPEGKITDRGKDICDVIAVAGGFTQKRVAEQVESFFRGTFDRVAIQEAHY